MTLSSEGPLTIVPCSPPLQKPGDVKGRHESDFQLTFSQLNFKTWIVNSILLYSVTPLVLPDLYIILLLIITRDKGKGKGNHVKLQQSLGVRCSVSSHSFKLDFFKWQS